MYGNSKYQTATHHEDDYVIVDDEVETFDLETLNGVRLRDLNHHDGFDE